MRHLLLLLCLFLLGCQTTAETAPTPAARFEPSQAAFARAKGSTTVRGQAFLRWNDGVVVYGAGSEALLVPKIAHTDEAIQKGFGAAKIHMEVKLFGANLMGNDYKFDPELNPFIRRSKADGQGNFTFEGVPPGQYYVLSRVTWCVPNKYGCDQQGGDLMEIVNVAPTDKAVAVMLTGA